MVHVVSSTQPMSYTLFAPLVVAPPTLCCRDFRTLTYCAIAGHVLVGVTFKRTASASSTGVAYVTDDVVQIVLINTV